MHSFHFYLTSLILSIPSAFQIFLLPLSPLLLFCYDTMRYDVKRLMRAQKLAGANFVYRTGPKQKKLIKEKKRSLPLLFPFCILSASLQSLPSPSLLFPLAFPETIPLFLNPNPFNSASPIRPSPHWPIIIVFGWQTDGNTISTDELTKSNVVKC